MDALFLGGEDIQSEEQSEKYGEALRLELEDVERRLAYYTRGPYEHFKRATRSSCQTQHRFMTETRRRACKFLAAEERKFQNRLNAQVEQPLEKDLRDVHSLGTLDYASKVHLRNTRKTMYVRYLNYQNEREKVKNWDLRGALNSASVAVKQELRVERPRPQTSITEESRTRDSPSTDLPALATGRRSARTPMIQEKSARPATTGSDFVFAPRRFEQSRTPRSTGPRARGPPPASPADPNPAAPPSSGVSLVLSDDGVRPTPPDASRNPGGARTGRSQQQGRTRRTAPTNNVNIMPLPRVTEFQ